jgi:hypothetical protein
LDLPRTPQHFLGSILDQAQVVALNKELMDRIRHAENELEPVVRNNIYALKPTFIPVGTDPLPDHLGNRRPYGPAIQCHGKLCTRSPASPRSRPGSLTLLRTAENLPRAKFFSEILGRKFILIRSLTEG